MWKIIIAFIIWLIEQGMSEESAISKASSKFGISTSEIRRHL